MSSHFNFTCKDCGSHELNVVWHDERDYIGIQNLYCFHECGSEGELAATIDHTRTERYKCWGPLDEDHRFTKEGEELIETSDEIYNEEIICEDCYEDSDENCWLYHEQTDALSSGIDFSVYCGGCNREIEFGWSDTHPNREGRIWPVECEDFNPQKIWPEPRFRENWEKRNCIRPDSERD